MKGQLVISLDFELHWGVSDHRTVESYRTNLQNTPYVVSRLLDLFASRNIHATWATVGMLMCRDKNELFSLAPPSARPSYLSPSLSNYAVANEAGENEQDDPFHFASSLVKRICSTPGQELSTHTFSHYYCLEPGQEINQFRADLEAARKIAAVYDNVPRSIVFPRNQYAPAYLEVCREAGILIYRGNFPRWFYRPQAKSKESKLKRIFRLADTYLPVAGTRAVAALREGEMMNIPASCFLRPYSKKLRMLEPLRLWRIKREMSRIAKRGGLYHLWWHPHNFGNNMEENFRALETILNHFDLLRNKYSMESKNMLEIYEESR